jgi:carbamate kinase
MAGPDGLMVVAVGGNAVSPPAGDLSLAGERRAIERTVAEIAPLARQGARLLLVHGNGPQVGRLLRAQGAGEADLDVLVAQTQGELGYLLSEALDAALGADACVAVVTRVIVDPRDPAFRAPDKPIGPALAVRPADVPCVRTPDGRGWRRVVASPRPHVVVEAETIRALLAGRHVVAGGGGGIALAGDDGRRRPCPCVVDKDWVAAWLATALGASRLVFVTDVPAACEAFGAPAARPIRAMTSGEARARLARGVFAPGSMAPKVESATEFAEATGRPATVTTIGEVHAALRGEAGTTITRD